MPVFIAYYYDVEDYSAQFEDLGEFETARGAFRAWLSNHSFDEYERTPDDYKSGSLDKRIKDFRLIEIAVDHGGLFEQWAEPIEKRWRKRDAQDELKAAEETLRVAKERLSKARQEIE